MSGIVVNAVKKKLKPRGKTPEKYPNSSHIFYDLIPVLDKDGKETKTEKQEKEWRHDILCISKNDAEVLKKVCKKAYRYDQKFEIHRLNLRFGWSAIIGLLPVIGDIIEVLMALSLIRAASKIDGGLGWWLWFRMVGNIALDFGLGFVPLAGDVVDFFYRANTRNAWILNDHLLVHNRTNRDVERGAGPAQMVQTAPVTPAAVLPAKTPAARPDMGPPSRTGTPGRNLTSQEKPRQPRDPRDRNGRR